MIVKKFLITNKQGQELGESSGSTAAEALYRLYRLARVPGVRLLGNTGVLVPKPSPATPALKDARFRVLA